MEKNLELSAAERLGFMLAGEMRAVRAMVSVLIASHPDPEGLKRIWHASKSEWIDTHAETRLHGQREFHDAFVETLGALSREIDESERLTRPGAR